jgi:nondiscriminating glutamyl-tRNA synthetase
MKTSLVIRSQEWYPSIAKHITMFKDFYGIECVPKYLHLPFILGEVGNKKMSKRDGSVNLQSYLDRGYLPEALVNYLAFLGWNPGTDKEMYF